MDAIFDLLSMIGNVITGVIDFVVSFVADLIFIVQFIAYVLIQVPGFFLWLPSSLSVILVVGISAAAIYKIAGRS